ncbi:MAG TPA: hypothetical protein PK595_02995 [Bacteroidota bacterium]|jgi:anti-sigma28 factor (negative regulator of flagellin synthesis)|nr:hypothetical protein [Bacteroidota bacterium]
MNINEISGNRLPLQGTTSKKNQYEKPVDALRKDTVELSDEARARFLSDNAKRLEEIQQKISDGFYNQQEVMERVVDALLKELL